MKKTITKNQVIEDIKNNLLKLIFLKKNKFFVIINLILYFKYFKIKYLFIII
jgi:hypothetical protein